MANVASPRKRTTIAEFLQWSEGVDGKFELRHGEAVAMAPPARAHGQLAMKLGIILDRQLRRPCRVIAEAGIAMEADDTLYQPDLAVTCTPHARTERMTLAPILIVEILSNSTVQSDRFVKLPDYRTLPSVKEIVLVDPERALLEIHRRAEDNRWYVDFVRGLDSVARLDSLPADGSLADLYEGMDLEP
jgi:Uma2 family endonuclease